MTRSDFDPRPCADWIVARRHAGTAIAALPADLKPRTEDEGYAVQALVRDGLSARGPSIGWKVGATTPAMQGLLNVPAPCAGEMHAAGRHDRHARLAAASFTRVGIECEIAAELATPLGGAGKVDLAQARAAVRNLHAAAEIVDDRYGDFRHFGVPSLIADFFFHAGVVLGPPVAAWRDIDLERVEGTTAVDGEVKLRGRGADVLGNPLASLVWLANRLTALGRRLEAGQIVMLGSLPLPYWAKAGDRVTVTLNGLGAVTIDLD
ncbi:MAG: fumarylacetoacetate hydrolase family protein [Alphaproteobacteria bacterium]|nr:fumarylacetoacetate hydrolase family protein [Alphaproteobacteria bacterium]